MKRLTLVQRERIRKTLTLAVSLLVFAASFAAIPYIVSVIPPVTAKGMHINDPNAPVGSGFTLGGGEAPSGNNSDTQAEESTPGTENAESEPRMKAALRPPRHAVKTINPYLQATFAGMTKPIRRR